MSNDRDGLASRFGKFFAEPADDLNTYESAHHFKTTSIFREPWEFPLWIAGDQIRSDNKAAGAGGAGGVTFTKDGRRHSIPLEPNYSLYGLAEVGPYDAVVGSSRGSPAGDLRIWNFIGFDLGVIDGVPIRSGDFDTSAVMFLGLVFPPSLGGERMILPVTVYAHSRDVSLRGALVSPSARTFMTDHDLSPGNSSPLEGVGGPAIVERLREALGTPVAVACANQAAGAPGRRTPGITETVPDRWGVLHDLENLLLGDVDGFRSVLNAAGRAQVVLTSSDSGVPDFARTGFAQIDDALGHAPFCEFTFTLVREPYPALR